MTPDQMAELAARLSEKSARFRKHADFLLTIVPGDPINTVAANGLTADADDFDRAADLIESMAQRVEPEPCGYTLPKGHEGAHRYGTRRQNDQPERRQREVGEGQPETTADELRGSADDGIPSGNRAPAAPTRSTQRVPLEDQIMAACYSFRHDFGLLPRHDQTALMDTAREWARCFGIRSEK